MPIRTSSPPLLRLLLSTLVGLLLLTGLPASSFAQEADYGETEFANSGAAEAQDVFLRGILMLHSFEYVDARAAFQEALEIDPDFAMAAWGEAMTHNHPIWMEQDRDAALAALKKLGPTPEAQLDAAATERERHYLRTLHVLYQPAVSSPASKEARDDQYAEAMADLAATYPDDLDAQAFQALSILGTAHEGRDFSTYMRAAAIVEEVFDENPRHPGAAHYLIHAYDDPVHAPLGLRPARVYADVAPSASHALHMPSHIFFALGMWDRGASSNVDSYEAARKTTESRGEALNGHGFHALQWLHYARLQQGRYDEARSTLATAHTHAEAADIGYARFVDYTLPLVYILETEEWDRLDNAAIPFDADDTRQAVTAHATMGMIEALRDAPDAARKHLDAAVTALGEDDTDVLQMQIHQLKALLAHLNDDAASVVKHMNAATELEEARPLRFGPPFPLKPANELYGELLLEMDRPADALGQFDETLRRYPRRVTSLMGRAAAAARTGDEAAAAEALMQLQTIYNGADAAAKQRLSSLPATSDADATSSTSSSR